MLSQIGRKPLSDKSIEREVYALSAGIGLGLVNLASDGKAHGLADLELDERLIRLIEGGKTLQMPSSILSSTFHQDSNKCSSVMESDIVNVHITAPPAIIALALIHLKSNNIDIANRIEIPNTFYKLEYLKPFLLLLKILAKNLIMWDRIECTQKWLYDQIPEIISSIFQNRISEVQNRYASQIGADEIDYSSIALSYLNILAGGILALGFKYAGTANQVFIFN